MVSTVFLTEGRTTGSLKWNGNVNELKVFIEELVEINGSQWTRSDGHNGEPFVCKLGENVLIT